MSDLRDKLEELDALVSAAQALTEMHVEHVKLIEENGNLKRDMLMLREALLQATADRPTVAHEVAEILGDDWVDRIWNNLGLGAQQDEMAKDRQ